MADNATTTAKKDRKPREQTATLKIRGVDVTIPRSIGEQEAILSTIAQLGDVTLPEDHPLILKRDAILEHRKGDVHAKASVSDTFRDGYMEDVTLDPSIKAWIEMETIRLERSFRFAPDTDPATIKAMRKHLAQVMIRRGVSEMCRIQESPTGSTVKTASIWSVEADTATLVRELKAPKGSRDPKAPEPDNAQNVIPNAPENPDHAPGNVNGNGNGAASDVAHIPENPSPDKRNGKHANKIAATV